MRRGLSSSHPVPGACSSGLPNARRRSPDAWRARRAWSRAAARSGALTPPWPRSASASAARVTVTKHSAPPCHNKSPGAPAAGDPYPRLASATTLRGCTGWARVRTWRGHALPPTACTSPRATAGGARSWLPTASSAGARSPPSHPPRVSLLVPRVQSAPPGRHAPRFREEPRAARGPRIGAAVLRGPGRHAWEEREGGNRRRARRGGSSPSCRCRAEGAGRGSGRP